MNIKNRIRAFISGKPVYAQLRVYAEFVRRRGHFVNDIEWVEQFCRLLEIENMEDTTDVQVAHFTDWVAERYRTEYAVASARRAVNKVRRYFMARARRGDTRTHWDMVEKVRELRDREGLSFRAIAEILGRDVRQIHRWYTYEARPKLSTGKSF